MPNETTETYCTVCYILDLEHIIHVVYIRNISYRNWRQAYCMPDIITLPITI